MLFEFREFREFWEFREFRVWKSETFFFKPHVIARHQNERTFSPNSRRAARILRSIRHISDIFWKYPSFGSRWKLTVGVKISIIFFRDRYSTWEFTTQRWFAYISFMRSLNNSVFQWSGLLIKGVYVFFEHFLRLNRRFLMGFARVFHTRFNSTPRPMRDG